MTMHTSFPTATLAENCIFFTCIAHNFFEFYFFLARCIQRSVWRTKKFSIGGSQLINVNFPNLGEQVKFVDTPKYYQQTLVGLAETVAPEEKFAIIKLSSKFLQAHYHFKGA